MLCKDDKLIWKFFKMKSRNEKELLTNNDFENNVEKSNEINATEEPKSSLLTKRRSMSSETSIISENGGQLADSKSRKSLRSVITDNDPLKIKLKITKRDIVEPSRSRRESLNDSKNGRSQRNSIHENFELKNGGDKSSDESQEEKTGDETPEKKMKLRRRKETEEETDSKKEEIEETQPEGKKKDKDLDESWNDSATEMEKPVKKRGRPPKQQNEETEDGAKRRSKRKEELNETAEEEKVEESNEEVKDEAIKESFCWTCHKEGSIVKCDTCPRVFHLKCVSLSKNPPNDWICPECSSVLHAETISTRSEAMKSVSLDQLCTLLSFAIDRMKDVPESEAFWKPVDPKEVPFYDKYITNPMDLNLLERNMKAKMYGSPQAFLADAKWLLHNSIIFNSTQSPLTSTARLLVKICRQEMAEIENCPDCYLNAHVKQDWFVEVCRKPHILIWARLKGFPFWPAKAMSTNLKTQTVDARFFGAHDKAWVPVKECYLYSRNSPQTINKKRSNLGKVFTEVEAYIKNIKRKYGSFEYAPDRTPFVPEELDVQLQKLIPSYKEEKSPKKKKKEAERSGTGENGVVEKTVQNGKKVTEHGTLHRFKLKRPAAAVAEDVNKLIEDICLMSDDFASEEKVLNDDHVCPEDEIARSLEMYDTHGKSHGETIEENSTDLEEDSSVPIPEHGYSRSFESVSVSSKLADVVEGNAETKKEETPELSASKETEEISDKDEVKEKKDEEAKEGDASEEKKSDESAPTEADENTPEESKAEENEADKPDEANSKPEESEKPETDKNERCEVTSTDPDVQTEEEKKRKSADSNEALEKPSESDPKPDDKKDEEKSQKSFTNLTTDQKQKILTEAKLLANIDEMTALGKQKVLNDLGLDASQVDIKQLAQENRDILETLNKKAHNDVLDALNKTNEERTIEDVPIKNEDFEQYLMEESNDFEEHDFTNSTTEETPPPPRLGTIKVRDLNSLSITKTVATKKYEPMLKIMDIKTLKDLKNTRGDFKAKRKKSTEEPTGPKKLKTEPVLELIKLDSQDRNVQKLNRKLRLSDEVSLLMVDNDSNKKDDESDSCKNSKKLDKASRARKSMPNRTKDPETNRSPPKNVNVISVDTENSNAQKSLLKSLRLEEKKSDNDRNRKIVIATNDKSLKTGDVSKNLKEVTIEAVKDNSKSSDNVKDNSSPQQKNVTVVANSHLILTNNGPTFLTNQNNQPGNLALTQNNLGQLSLVHLTNLTSGIQTNFVNLANETIGFNNSLGTIYASPNFNSEAFANSGGGSVLVSPGLASNLPCTTAASNITSGGSSLTGKSGKAVNDKVPIPRIAVSKPTSGISVKSPASLGLVTSQSNKLPPLVAKPNDEENSHLGEIGSVTAELNRHSIKLAEYMRSTIEDMLRELSNQGSLEAKYKSLLIEMEKLQWRHQQEILELKHNSERSMMELRNALETEKQKSLAELRSQLEAQHQKAISETKHKQWCANCGKEALFYCCWNTSYCDYPCQQQHWPGHMSTCAQLGNNVQANNQMQNKAPGIKYNNANYVPIISGAGGAHTGGPFSANRAVSNIQNQTQLRRGNEQLAPQLPINITIRPQHYFM